MRSSRSSTAAAPSPGSRSVSNLRDELYSLLVPLAGERLIVPRACVAEVISYQVPTAMNNAPPWYAGSLSLRDRRVPIVSFEAAFGQALPTVTSRTRIVIFHSSAAVPQTGFFGMLTQGFPQLVRVNADVVRPDPSRSFADHLPVICQIRMVNETPLIPDLERLEEMIAEETSAAS